MGSRFPAQRKVAQGGELHAVLVSWSATRSTVSLAVIGVVVGSTDSAWSSDSFMTKGCADSALKALQLQSGLLLS